MSKDKEGRLFQQGEYLVEVAGVEYGIKNISTGVVEETTSFLFEAIRLAKVYDKLLKEAYTLEPKRAFGEADEQEEQEPATTLPTQLN